MNQQEKVRKYMIKDIIRHNLRFWWIILACVVAVGAVQGYRKNAEYQRRFTSMQISGVEYQITDTLYTGNIANTELYSRVSNVKNLLSSNMMYEQYIKDTGYTSIDYALFSQMYSIQTEYEDDHLKIVFVYPAGCGHFLADNEEEAKVELSKYMLSANKIIADVIGEGVVVDIGISKESEISYLPTEDNYKRARQDTIKSTIIGAIIGLVGSIAVITLLYLLNSTLKTPVEVAGELRCKLLATLGVKEEANKKEFTKAVMVLSNDKTNKYINVMNLEGVNTQITSKLVDSFLEYGMKAVSVDITNTGNKMPNDIEELGKNYDVVLIQTIDVKDSMSAFAVSQKTDATIVVAETMKHNEKYTEKIVDAFELFDIKNSGVIVYDSHK